ncbi:MAG: hypothetical protein ACTH2Q_06475 [Propionibacteriaceae bacterium]
MTGEHGPDPGRDRDAAEVDRAFAEMVARYDLEAPDPPEDSDPVPAPPPEWARFTPRRPDPEPEQEPEPVDHHEDPVNPDNHYVPENPRPLRRPGTPVLLALMMMGFAVACAIVTMLGVSLPSPIRLLGVVAFVAGFVTLMAQLPRSRPDGDDGAVL